MLSFPLSLSTTFLPSLLSSMFPSPSLPPIHTFFLSHTRSHCFHLLLLHRLSTSHRWAWKSWYSGLEGLPPPATCLMRGNSGAYGSKPLVSARGLVHIYMGILENVPFSLCFGLLCTCKRCLGHRKQRFCKSPSRLKIFGNCWHEDRHSGTSCNTVPGCTWSSRRHRNQVVCSYQGRVTLQAETAKARF